MEKLIELVRSIPVLYDTSHADYMRGKLKDDLWEKVARELNYTEGKAAKEQWRKLRECHREALRRQEKKSGQQAKHFRLWTYQKQMEFLKPCMKNRNTVGYPTSTLEESQLEEDDISVSDTPSVEGTHDGEPIVPSETATPKRIKRSTTTDPIVQKFLEDSRERARKRDELRQNLVTETQKQDLQNDALYQFFMSMYNLTKVLPAKHQKQVRRELFQAVSDAEDKAAEETEAKDEIDQNLQMNRQRPLPSTAHPSDAFSCSILQEFPDTFSPSTSASVSSVETTERSCSRHEDDSSTTYFSL